MDRQDVHHPPRIPVRLSPCPIIPRINHPFRQAYGSIIACGIHALSPEYRHLVEAPTEYRTILQDRLARLVRRRFSPLHPLRRETLL